MSAQDQTASFLKWPSMHLCVDMQRMFADPTPWRAPWTDDVRPIIERLVALAPERTIFTRFIPPEKPEDAQGAWADYFGKWRQFTTSEIDPHLLELVPELARLASRGLVIDKMGYSAFTTSKLLPLLVDRGVQTLIVTGVETDVCVLSTVMSAVDHGFRVVLAKDALCSSTDETHDALLALYAERFDLQVVLSNSDEIAALWPQRRPS